MLDQYKENDSRFFCNLPLLKKYLYIALFAFGFTGTTSAQFFGLGQLFVQMVFSWEEGGYEVKYTTFNNEPAYIHGLRGGWYINSDENFVLGFSGYAASTTINESFSLLNRQRFTTFYTTLFLDYTFYQDKKIQINPILHFGYGYAELQNLGFSSTPDEYSGFFLMEPNINASMGLGRVIRIGGGVGYRVMSGLRMNGADSYSLGGASLNAFIKFGPFGD